MSPHTKNSAPIGGHKLARRVRRNQERLMLRAAGQQNRLATARIRRLEKEAHQ